jgi:hypothetical protein
MTAEMAFEIAQIVGDVAAFAASDRVFQEITYSRVRVEKWTLVFPLNVFRSGSFYPCNLPRG